MNPTGPAPPNLPYFIVKRPILVKKILVPEGTKLVYEKHFFKSGQQTSLIDEEELTQIKLPDGKILNWGGVPVNWIDKFPNEKMTGFTVWADFTQLRQENKTKFSELWESCDKRLSVSVKNSSDWSFNTENISDVEGCGTNQRYFKEDLKQQNFLDSTINELKKIQIRQLDNNH
jgi:hypothetical protein